MENVAQNYTDIKEGKVRNRNKTYIIEVSDKYNNTLFVELSQDGSYWNVNSADVFRKKYSQGKKPFGLLPKCRISNRLLMILCGHKGIPIPILPQTELYPKWYMPKIAKNPQIYKKRIIKIAILSDIKAEREAIRAEQKAAKQEYDYWNNVKTLLNRQDVNTTEQIAEDGNETHKNGIRLTAEEVVDLLSQMEDIAEVVPEMELSAHTWAEIFDENNSITTPVGQVKMGDNQINKFFAKGREKSFGMVAPTLSNPDVVIEKDAQSPNAERNTKYLFIKTFIKSDGSRYVHFETVTVRKDGMEVSISSHEVDRKVAKKEMQNGIILHLNNKLSLDSERYLIETQNDGRPDLVPASDNNISKSQGNVFAPITEDTNVPQFNSPTYKYSKKNPIIRERREKNAQEEESAEQQLYPVDEKGEPLWYDMTDEQFDVAMTELGDDADAFIADNIKEAQKAIKKAEKAKPKSAEFAKRKAEQQAISAEKAAAQKAYDYWTAQQARRSENAQSENIIENEIDKKEEILNLQQTYENNVRQTESTNRGKLQSETPQSDRSRKQRTSQISQSIPQREFRTQDEGNRRMAQAESAIRRGKSDRNNETQLSGSESAISGLEKEQREAEAYAKANGIWIPYTELSELGYPSLSGNENENYTGEDGYIYKVNNLQNSGGILSLFNRINLHNEIFPETSYTFIGRTQPIKRPNYWIAAQTADKNSITVLEVNKGKDNVEM